MNERIINIFLKVRKKEGRKIRMPNIQVHVGICSQLAQKHTLQVKQTQMQPLGQSISMQYTFECTLALAVTNWSYLWEEVLSVNCTECAHTVYFKLKSIYFRLLKIYLGYLKSTVQWLFPSLLLLCNHLKSKVLH